MEVRTYRKEDVPQIWKIFQKVVSTGDTYVFPTDSSYEVFEENWLKYNPVVASEGDKILGTYIIKKNQIGLGSHIGNGSYMVDPGCHGRGVGKKLGIHSLKYAWDKGFKGLQFNLVVSTNEPAIKLWEKIGFKIIGTTPGAFMHKSLGYVDAHIMFRDLSDMG